MVKVQVKSYPFLEGKWPSLKRSQSRYWVVIKVSDLFLEIPRLLVLSSYTRNIDPECWTTYNSS